MALDWHWWLLGFFPPSCSTSQQGGKVQSSLPCSLTHLGWRIAQLRVWTLGKRFAKAQKTQPGAAQGGL